MSTQNKDPYSPDLWSPVVDVIITPPEEPPPPPPDDEPCGPAGSAEARAARLTASQRGELSRLQAERARLDTLIPESAFAMIGRDEDPRDVGLHIRGDHQNLGDPVPRRA